MASTSMTLSTSPAAATRRKDRFKEHNGLCRSNSCINLQKKQGGIRRSYSDNHLCYSSNQIRCYDQSSSAKPKLKNSRSSVGIFSLQQISSSIIPDSLKSFLYDPETSKDLRDADADEDDVNFDENEKETVNWVERLLQIRSLWKNRQVEEEDSVDNEVSDCDCGGEGDEIGCAVNYHDDSEEMYDSESFSKFLSKVSWSDTRLLSQLAFLCNLAYVIPEIKEIDLKRCYGLQFVTSSVEQKAEVAAIKAKLNQDDSTRVPVVTDAAAVEEQKKRPIRSSVAYGIAASAALYAKNGLSRDECELIDSDKLQIMEGENSPRVYKSEVAAYVTASTVTAVVAAGEKEKQEAAKDLRSAHSSPCEWFICDDSSTYTRCFVIQGSDSLGSWLANLLFEPNAFENTDVLVHRGIYEVAKGIYEQFLPEIIDHLKKHGDRAKFQFTGHSLGGSLSVLINLMLLSRGILKPSASRPVVTFGSPFVFCGGHKLLKNLGLNENHIHSVMMHRDIVPRAFSCDYPNYISVILKRLSSFRTHPCLKKHKLLYSPLGKVFILQPEEKSSPSHPLLPPGTALFALNKSHPEYSENAFKAFLNLPHPLDILSDPTAYGSEGTIKRDHHSSHYLKAINGILRQHKKAVSRKVLSERLNASPWPLLVSPSPHSWSHRRLVSTKVMSGV